MKTQREIRSAAFVLAFLCLVGSLRADHDYTAWEDYTANPLVDPGSRADYPSVLYDYEAFGVSGGATWRMWYGASGTLRMVTSSDGLAWGSSVSATGLTNPGHAKVLYDADGFGITGGAPYRVWYWTSNMTYTLDDLHTAQSSDGIDWDDDQAVTQSSSNPLITGMSGTGWNRGSYGPACVLYQPGASNSGTDPWDYRFVMYYDGTSGGTESLGLAYSSDGIDWTAYSTSAVLPYGGSGSWDAAYATFGTVFRDENGYHLWYSGGQSASHEGIGYASSPDGLTWTKDANNPLFAVGGSAPTYRAGRAYTPDVILAPDGSLRMYYGGSPTGSGSDLRICLARDLTPLLVELVSFEALPCQGGVRLDWVTETEIRNAGFHLWRAESEEGPYARITETLIPGRGQSEISGAAYTFTDPGVFPRTRYWYRLEDVEDTGARTFHGPVSVMVPWAPAPPRNGNPAAASGEVP
ncbi:MAG: hypothetical protein KA419_09210 [Acidobacteria bacterium]|nr:hypothetical protein [Acidobacteriota bacterium]